MKKIVFGIIGLFLFSQVLFATTSNIAVTEGSGKYVASNSISEDAVTKQLQRVVVNDSSGVELPAISSDNKTMIVNSNTYSTAQTAQTIWTPTSGKKFVITDIIISASAAGTIVLFDNTNSATTLVTPVLTLAANGGCVVNFGVNRYTSAAANNVLKYTSGSGAAGNIMVKGYEV